jgi:hypothetical protein
MKRRSIKILFLIIPFFLICGCAKQNIVEIPNSYRSGGKISIFFTPPQKAFEVISVINASTFTDDFTSHKDAEDAALTKLMNLAEKVGADGIIEVYLEFLEGGELISSIPWEGQSNTDYNKTESAIGGGCVLSPSINFKGMAIKFVD